MAETAINFYSGDDRAWFCSDDGKFIRLITKLSKERPGEVLILKEPKNNNGMLYCEIPVSWFKVKPPRKMNYTAKQKEEIAERLRLSRES